MESRIGLLPGVKTTGTVVGRLRVLVKMKITSGDSTDEDHGNSWRDSADTTRTDDHR